MILVDNERIERISYQDHGTRLLGRSLVGLVGLLVQRQADQPPETWTSYQ